jgi:hypothetical protein
MQNRCMFRHHPGACVCVCMCVSVIKKMTVALVHQHRDSRYMPDDSDFLLRGKVKISLFLAVRPLR